MGVSSQPASASAKREKKLGQDITIEACVAGAAGRVGQALIKDDAFILSGHECDPLSSRHTDL